MSTKKVIDSINKIISDINYKVIKKIGEGNFGTVKLAIHSFTGEKVAIKILEKTRISSIEDKERINRETEIMKKINHCNIVKLYQIVENKLNIYLIQEYIEGKDFMEYLNQKGKLKEVEACKFYHQIISALEYLHQCGIAHRDFKPENIILSNNTLLKIIDFGLGNLYNDSQLLRTACGSPCYAPPEMIKEECYSGASADTWSSGVVLYLMLCGRLPFYHEENTIMYQQILSGKFDLPNYLSNEAKDLLTKLLEIDPKKRIKFEKIKSHSWFNIINGNHLIHKGINIKEDIKPIDEEIIKKMEDIGFNKMELRFSLIKNFHNKVTTVYELLLKKKIATGQKSVADLFSDLYDEYMSKDINKIKHYGSLESALKHRICENNKKINILPNYYEDKYDDNNENIIIGDSGTVLERLIKAGKFSFDEENMRVNKVSNANKLKGQTEIRKESNPMENKYKTLTEIKINKSLKLRDKRCSLPNTDNNFKIVNEAQKMYMKKKTITKKNSKNFELKINNNKSKETENKIKEDKLEEDDWYKEVEAMVIGENKMENEMKMRDKRSTSLYKRKKNDEERKSPMILEEIIKTHKRVSSSVDMRPEKKMTSKNVNNHKFAKKNTTIQNHNKKGKINAINNSNKNKRKSTKFIASKTLTTSNKGKESKMKNDGYKYNTNPITRTSMKDPKGFKMDKRDVFGKIKKFEIEEKEDIIEKGKAGRKRGLSCARRSKKMKI